MEVKNLGQGRQTSFSLNTNPADNSSQCAETTYSGSNAAASESKNSEWNFPSNNKQGVSEKDVKKAADKLNKLLEGKATHVEYELYGKSKELTIRIVNDKTKEVVREMPPKKLIDMVDKLCELAGVFVDQKA
ncbi:flagellar protein FlaG [Clostridium sp. CX1]|uniref:flagellar protein FlaG n=1 Tax=Clostridium sp. CX1 TaxID=2978346 RepID=UPI0021BE18EC|nr:flagellar protein FlaG [Clostridium sp. CX1]MCT8976137.1 flagellar protein FlaG [Clostridium sp. CX1]